MRKVHGFTLLEVLIALAIFSICAMVILKQVSQSLHYQQALEIKTLALWVAENTIAGKRLEKTWPDTGNYQTTTVFSAREWTVDQSIEATGNPALRKITVRVFLPDTDSPSISLTGYLGKY